MPPAIDVTASHQPGTSLTGPLAEPAPQAEGDEPLWLRCTALWVEREPVLSDPLDQRARLIVTPGRSDLLQPLARRAAGLTAVSGEAAAALRATIEAGSQGRSATAWDQHARLSRGVVYRVGARAAGSGLAVEDLVVEAARSGAEPAAELALALGAADESARELVILRDPLLPGTGSFAFVLPRAPRAEHEPAALVVFVETLSTAAADGDDGVRAASVAESSARAAASAALDRGRNVPRAEAERRELAAAARGLDSASERRASLVYLAGTCGAPLALDVALVAEEQDLAALAHAVHAALGEPQDRAGSAWPIERAAWTELGRTGVEGRLAPELSGVLARAGGEAARLPGAIEDLLRGCTGVADLQARLVVENRILLEDASPSARVRACDWLAQRGLAPEGFDPLGSLAERRAALRQASESEDARANRTQEPK